jgi:iron complex outermembrane receptor protein
VGNGYRAPSLYERFGASFFFGSFSAYGDPRLAPERFISVDGGFDQYFAHSNIRMSGTYFYTRLQQVIAFDFSGRISPTTDPFGRFGGYTTEHGGLSRGVEFAVEAHPISSLTLNAAYTYTNADDRRSIYAGGELRSVNVSDHMFTANVMQRIGRRVDVAFDLFAASDYLFPLFVGFQSQAFRFDGPVKADIAAGYTLPVGESRTLRFFTRIENVFNRTYFEDGFATPKAWAVAGVKFGF